MRVENNEQKRIRNYLLGQMAEDDLTQVEERLLIDFEFYEELSSVEGELIDEYLRGELPASDRKSFESHFLIAPERHEKLRFALALKKYVSAERASQPQEEIDADKASEGVRDVVEPPPKPRPFFSFLPFRKPVVSYAFAAAMVLVVGGIIWVAWKNQSGSGKVVAIQLTPSSMTREGGDPTDIRQFSIPHDAETVRLQLDLPQAGYATHEVVVQDADLRPVFTKKNLTPQSLNGRPAAFVEIPRLSLPPGDYRIKLSGTTATGRLESVAGYSFRVTK